MSDIDFSQHLRSVKHKIETVLRQNNVSGSVVLHDGQGMSEYGCFWDLPTWSNLRFVTLKNGSRRVHLKVHMKSNPEDTAATVNALVHAKDVNAFVSKQADVILSQLKNIIKIEMDDKPTFMPEK